MSASREVNNETMAGVNSRFGEVSGNDVQDNGPTAIPNNTKKAIKLGMKFLEIRNVNFDKQFFHMSSVFCPPILSQS